MWPKNEKNADYVKTENVWSHDTIFRQTSKQFSICRTCKFIDQVFAQDDFKYHSLYNL
jgi:hypothetical protein